MEKLYDIKFIYKDEALKSERFTGEFSTDSTADEILNVLMHTNTLSYKKDGRIVQMKQKKDELLRAVWKGQDDAYEMCIRDSHTSMS